MVLRDQGDVEASKETRQKEAELSASLIVQEGILTLTQDPFPEKQRSRKQWQKEFEQEPSRMENACQS